MKEGFDTSNCSLVDGKLALPYTYLAGRTGSIFLTKIQDEKKITGIKCRKCNIVYVPPRQICDNCFSDIRDNWVNVKNTGKIVNYTVIRYDAPHLPRKSPFILALIKLDGAGTPLAHIVEGIPLDKIKNGLKVKAVFSGVQSNTILDIDHFEPC